MIKRLFLWICIMAIALNVFSYTFEVDVNFENAFNLAVGSFIDLIGSLYEDIKNVFGWLWGRGSFMNAFDYIMEESGLSMLWQDFLDTLPFVD